MGGSQRYGSQGDAHHRVGQKGSGCPLAGQVKPNGMDFEAGILPDGIRPPGNTNHRSTCDGRQPQTASVLLEIGPSGILSDRHILVPMGRSGRICFPTIRADPQDATQASTLAGATTTDRSVLATTPLMDQPYLLPRNPGRLSQNKGRILHPNPHHLHLAAWRLSGITSDRRDFCRRLQSSPQGQGESLQLRLMNQVFQVRDGVRHTTSTLTEIVTFRNSLFDESKQPSTIKIYRSAISAIHQGFSRRLDSRS